MSYGIDTPDVFRSSGIRRPCAERVAPAVPQEEPWTDPLTPSFRGAPGRAPRAEKRVFRPADVGEPWRWHRCE